MHAKPPQHKISAASAAMIGKGPSKSPSLNEYINHQQQFRVTKNLIDLNLQIQPVSQQQQQQVRASPKNMLKSETPTSTNSSSGGGKFLDEILVQGKRSLNPIVTSPVVNLVANSSSAGLLGGITASLQLPTTIAVINRSGEERTLFPDKLILER